MNTNNFILIPFAFVPDAPLRRVRLVADGDIGPRDDGHRGGGDGRVALGALPVRAGRRARRRGSRARPRR